MQKISLNEELWRFCPDLYNEGFEQQWMNQENQPYLDEKTEIIVPSCWNRKNLQKKFGDVKVAWYWKSLKIPKSFINKKVFLYFARIAHKATIFIDGEEMGDFNGGFIPFEIDITKFIDNEPHFLAVQIDARDETNKYPKIPAVNEYYGIFGDVFIRTEDFIVLEERSMETILHYDASKTKVKFAELTFSLYFKNHSVQNYSGKIKLEISRDFVQVTEVERYIEILKLNSRLVKIIIHINKEDLELWSPQTPNLYKLNIVLSQNKKNIVTLEEDIGIREIQVNEDQLNLNGIPFIANGADFEIDEEEFGYSIPKVKIIDKLMKLKEKKVNIIRPNQGVFDHFILKMASRLGFLVIEDIPVPSLTLLEKQTYFNSYIYEITYEPSLAIYTCHRALDMTNNKISRNLIDLEKLFTNRLDPSRFFLINNDLFYQAKSWLVLKDGDYVDIIQES